MDLTPTISPRASVGPNTSPVLLILHLGVPMALGVCEFREYVLLHHKRIFDTYRYLIVFILSRHLG